MKKYTLKRIVPGRQGQPRNDENRQYIIDYKRELNPMQYEAVTNLDGPQLVIAGAGSGKTRTLVYRVAYMVENNITPQSILLLTFTRKSAREMMRRAASILDERCRKVSGGTYHSFANTILRKYAVNIGMLPNFTIMDRGDAEDIINVVREKLKLNRKDKNDKRFPRKNTLMDIISKAVNKCTTIEKIVLEDYPHYEENCARIEEVARLYHQFKRDKQVMDYDDLLVNLKKLLEEDPEVRRKISNTYRYIMVDEYQDTNRLQSRITLLLGSEHQNVLVVGDDSQSIYSFRGADFRNIMDFPGLFPGCRITTLEQNYRSTRPILQLTNAIIEQAREKFTKELYSDIEGDQRPIYIDTEDENEQGAFISQRILELRDEGIELSKIAVLFRASWHANELEVELKNANIPYVKYGGLKFAEAAHVKDTLAYMRVVHNVYDEIAWLRLLLLLEGVGPASAGRIIDAVVAKGGDLDQLVAPAFAKKKYYRELQNLHQLLVHISTPSMPPTTKMEEVIEYYMPFFETKYDDYNRRREDLTSLLHISQRYSDLEEMLTDMTLEPPNNTQEGAEATDEDDEKLVLSTIHSAKGLEWHTVFIINLVEGYFPPVQSLKTDEQVEEERRLFYVAATRAQHNLYLIKPELQPRTWSSFDSSGITFSEISRFLTEIPDLDQLVESVALEYDNDDPF